MSLSRALLAIAAVWCQAGPVRGGSGVPICSCDLSPGNCDLNCCCDPDCNPSDAAGIFTSCLPGSTKAERWACVYDWLIFRNNTPYTTALLGLPPARLFCVLSANASLNYFVTPREVNGLNFQSVSESYRGPSFSAASQGVPVFSGFYKAGDPILTVTAAHTVSVLRQPAPLGAQNICSDHNPANFLLSGSSLCLRLFDNLTDVCETESSLDPAYYYRDIAVLRVPADVTSQVPITSSGIGRPVLRGDRCDNVVSQVTYTVRYNGTRGISSVNVAFTLHNVSTTSASVQQNFTVVYKLRLVISLGGETCSYSPVQFGINALSGCVIRGTTQESCSDYQTRAYQILVGGEAPQSLAIYGNVTATQSQYWSQIIYQNCSSQGTCSSGCRIPVLLDMQIMWANVGLISNPQAQLLRARFLFTCQFVKCEDPTLVQTKVSFTDLTRRGPAPRSSPGITGREPVDFFFPFETSTATTHGRSHLLYFAFYCWPIGWLIRHV